jgi:uncharacterized protein (TIGR00369 family)
MLERERLVRWADPQIAATAARDIDGHTYLERIRDGVLPVSPYAALLGMRLVEVGDGHVVFAAEPAEHAFNAIGIVHGGYTSSLLDSAIGCAVISRLPVGKKAVSLDLQVRFFRGMSAATGPIRCEGWVMHLGRTTAAGEAKIFDANGRLHAHATSTLAILAET